MPEEEYYSQPCCLHKHKTGKERLLCKEAKERDLAQALAHHDASVNLVGETLPSEQKVYRVKILKTFLRAAIPLTKMEISVNFWRRMHIASLTVDTCPIWYHLY